MRHGLICSTEEFAGLLRSGILPISNEEHSAAGVEVAPFNSCNFVLPYRCCDRKLIRPTGICCLIFASCRDNAIELVLRGAAITLIRRARDVREQSGRDRLVQLTQRRRAPERMAPLIIGRPDQKGSTGRDNRMFVEGVRWIVRTGSP
jgi:hypothetical protein